MLLVASVWCLGSCSRYPLWLLPWSSFTCFLFLYRHFALLSYPGTPHNFLSFLSLVLLVLRTSVICISSLILFQKASNSNKPFFFLHLHSPAKPPLMSFDLPNLNSLTSTPGGPSRNPTLGSGTFTGSGAGEQPEFGPVLQPQMPQRLQSTRSANL